MDGLKYSPIFAGLVAQGSKNQTRSNNQTLGALNSHHGRSSPILNNRFRTIQRFDKADSVACYAMFTFASVLGIGEGHLFHRGSIALEVCTSPNLEVFFRVPSTHKKHKISFKNIKSK
ncbi:MULTISPECIES: hypothetical protein [Pseudomonas]|uniref:hypothetical protein n=1 Tax=Pseudomonas TaxID=286 RepID=UPI001887304A|nr:MULTISPECIES: hypothetical protein [Pseudomonas]QOY71192.1 hypothetical protein IH404_26205 [Pseudomonas sp. OST1909]WPN55330.1 hypothetical protein QMK52_09565 [Pseudomonas sp. P9_2]